ncbi:arginase family protein, partial [Luteimonas salinilitoris]
MRPKTAVIDAPSNLGLRPPKEGCVPGCYKMPWALRNAGLISALDAVDLGCVVPPRYDPSWQPGNTTRNSREIAAYSAKLAAIVEETLERGLFPLVVGGDCSILIGTGLALKRRGTHGLLFLDGHTDFRHLGNTGKIDAAAGEDLAISVGLGDAGLTNLSAAGANFQPKHVAVLGPRQHDEHLDELKQMSIYFATSTALQESGQDIIEQALRVVTDKTLGFWVHIDFDVVDASEMFAADCPEPGGISFSELSHIIAAARSTTGCLGMDITIYDPDLDAEALCAPRIVSCLSKAL